MYRTDRAERADRADKVDGVFRALADPSRRAIVARLAQGDASVSDLATPLDMSMPGVLKHLGVLQSAGLITTAKHGRVKRCHLNVTAFDAVDTWLAHTRAFWHLQLDTLGDFLASQENTGCPTPPRLRSASPSAATTPPRKRRSSAPGRTRRR